jgi:hypothetical protein
VDVELYCGQLLEELDEVEYELGIEDFNVPRSLPKQL